MVNELYMLRDDEKLLSINVGVIHGGTTENVVCDEATLRAEVRSFDPGGYRCGLGENRGDLRETGDSRHDDDAEKDRGASAVPRK